MKYLLSQKHYVISGIFMLTLLSPNFAFAGVGAGGGGDGYVASFVRTARAINTWLETNGNKLNPPVHAHDFEDALDPNHIDSTDEDLIYKGKTKDCLFDGGATGDIHINRDRWDNLKPGSPEQTLVVAHELFRKMGIEGDGYEVSSQLPTITPESYDVNEVIQAVKNLGNLQNYCTYFNSDVSTLEYKRCIDEWISSYANLSERLLGNSSEITHAFKEFTTFLIVYDYRDRDPTKNGQAYRYDNVNDQVNKTEKLFDPVLKSLKQHGCIIGSSLYPCNE